MTSVTLLGVRVDDIGRDEARSVFACWLAEDGRHVVSTPNPEFVLLAQRDEAFRARLNASDLALPDGVGLRFASAALTDHVIRNRVPGVDALAMLAELCAARGLRMLLVGSQPSLVQAANVLRSRFPGIDIVCVDPGHVDREGELGDDALRRIREAEAAVIAVGLGQGKQEACIARYVHEWPGVRVAIGVGGAFAMIGGVLPRAPRVMRAMGLEWVWRVVREPKRLRRILAAFPGFPAVVVWTTLRQRRFVRACRRAIPEIFRQLLGR